MKVYKKTKATNYRGKRKTNKKARLGFFIFWKKYKRTLFPVFIVSLIFLFGFAYYSLKNASKVTASWFNDNWLHRKSITITNSGSELTDYQVDFTFDTATPIAASKMQSDCGDIRVTDSTGNNLPYWIEDDNPGCDNAATTIWVKMKTVPVGDSTIYVYYGNNTADNASNGDAVFDFFEDFEGETISSLEADGWVKNYTTDLGHASPPSYSIVDGRLFIDNNVGWGSNVWFTKDANLQNGIFRTRVNQTNYYIAIYTKIGLVFRTEANPDSVNSLPTAFWQYKFEGASTDFAHSKYGGNNANGTGSYSQNTWHTIEVAAFDTETKAYYDGSLESTLTETATSGGMGATAYEVEGYWEYFLIRDYAAVEPTAGSAGSEETTPGPAAYWKFDEGYGSTVNDSTAQGHDGSLGVGSSAPEWQTEDMCVSGKCLYFDGTDDYVDTATNPWNNVQVSEGTLSAWIRTNKNASSSIILLSDEGWFNLGIDANGKIGGCSDGICTWATSSTTVTDNNWHHVSVTWSESSYTKIYVDGKEEASITPNSAPNPDANSRPFRMATHPANFNGEFYQGFLDDVKIYHYARSADEIKADYNSKAAAAANGSASVLGTSKDNNDALSNGLVGYWKMDESSANTCSGGVNDACDSSGNGKDGTWNGTAADGAGKFGNGVVLDGNSDYVEIDDGGDYTDARAISVWFKGYSESGKLIFKGDTGGDYFTLDLRNNYIRATWDSSDESGDKITINGTTDISAGTDWHHAVLVREGDCANTTLKVYLDGVEEASGTGDLVSCNVYDYDLQIGRRGTDQSTSTSDSYFGGTIDEVRLYDRALSPQEVRDLYNWAPGPHGYWNLDEMTGQNVYDKSGHAFDATLGDTTGTENQDPVWAKGKLGYSLEFDGYDDYLDITNNASLGNYDQVTVMAWVYTDDLDDGFIYNETYANNSYKILLQLDEVSGSLYLRGRIRDGTPGTTVDFTSNGTIALNTWTHVALVFDSVSDQHKLYINGVLDKTHSQSINDITGSTHAVRLGKQQGNPEGGPNYYKGKIDEVKTYTYARTTAQITEDMNSNHPAPQQVQTSSTLPQGGLSAYWRFDEGYGSSTNDRSSNNYSGTISNASWTNSGKFGKALSYNGSTSHVDHGDVLDMGSDDFTLTAWIKTNQVTQGWIISKYWGTTGERSYNFGVLDTGYLRLVTSSTGSDYDIADSTVTVNDNNWHHVAVTKNGTTAQFYVDGYAAGSGAAKSSLYNNTNHLVIGSQKKADNTLGALFNGTIDEVKIYKGSALTQQQIKQDMNQSSAMVLGSTGTASDGSTPDSSAARQYCLPGDTTSCSAPIAEWKFDEKTGSSAYDTSENDNTGTISNATWKGAAECKNGNCLDYDNSSSSYVGIADDSSLDLSSSFSISAWAKSEADTGTHQFIIDKRQSGQNDYYANYYLDFDYSNNVLFLIGGGTTGQWCLTQSSSLPSFGEWHHYEAVFDDAANYAYLYIDGQLAGSTSCTYTPHTTAGSDVISIGRDNASGGLHYFNGQIDDIKQYNYARTPAQIAWDYNRGGPIAHWRFDENDGSTAHDASGNNYDGTLTNMDSADWITGKVNTALDFDGTDDYVDLDSHISDIEGLNAGTMTGWFKSSTASAGQYIFSISDKDVTTDFMLVGFNGVTGGYDDESFWFIFRRDSGSNQLAFYVRNGETYYADGNWHHFAVVTGNGDNSIYIDGVKQAVTFSHGSASTNEFTNLAAPDTMRISSRNVSGNSYAATAVDDLKIYNYPMTAQQVKQEYNQGSAIRFTQ